MCYWKETLNPWQVITPLLLKTGEEYDTLKESLAHIISDVNALIQERSITGDGQKVNLDFYLGGDYKVN